MSFLNDSKANANSSVRTETDSLGSVQVSDDALWGAQSQRSLKYFAISQQRFPMDFIYAMCRIKRAAAVVNQSLDLLDPKRSELIQRSCDEILAGRHDSQFPLSVWQTGSGTQTNMNLNEVIANRSNQLAGGKAGSYDPVHPNDHVNLSQSSNDVFPTAMHMVTLEQITNSLLPVLSNMHEVLQEKAVEFQDVIKTGRTHLMDAALVTLGQEFGGYAQQVKFSITLIETSQSPLSSLAIGGTAVGTGLNSHPQWAELMVKELGNISENSSQEFSAAENKTSQMASHDALCNFHGQLNTLASSLYKIAADIRLMNSGPRCGFAEITIPANEPGSSIMPGKVNPTQAEALTMVCLRVMGNQTAVTAANSQGQFELNTYKPLIIHSVLESVELLADSCRCFTEYCLEGIQANEEQLETYRDRSLMLATSLNPVLGYDQTAKVVQHALEKDISLKSAILELELLSEEEIDRYLDPSKMLSPSA